MNATWYRGPLGYAIIAAGLLLLALSTVIVVPETQQAVILRLETPRDVVNEYKPGEQYGRTEAGITFRIPLVDRVVWVDKKVLDIELPDQPVLSTDQQRLQVDAFARFRVVDPLQMVRTARDVESVRTALQTLLSSSLRNELGKRPFAALLSPERGQVMDNIQSSLQRLARQYGVEIVDVRIKHADLPDGSPLNSAYDRMKTARRQEATTIRAQGLKEAQIIRANASAQAAQIYAASFGKDPEFYDFYRAMQSYRTTFLAPPPEGQEKADTSIILSPDNSYLKEFMGQR